MDLMSSAAAAPAWLASYGIPLSAILGVAFAIFLWYRVSQIRVGGGSGSSGNGREYLLEEEQRGEAEVCDILDFDGSPKPNAVSMMCILNDI